MTRLPLPSMVFIVVAVAGVTRGEAQQFKVARYSIGGDGNTDYIVAEPGTGQVFVSRSTHFMVIDGDTGKVLGDITDTPRAQYGPPPAGTPAPAPGARPARGRIVGTWFFAISH